MLLAAEHPVIRAGQGVLYAQAWDELREFAELLAIPVYTSMNGKSAFVETHPLSLGCGARTNTKQSMAFAKRADVIFAIGSSCTNETFTSPIPAGKVLIQTTIDERDINKSFPVAQAIIGDAKIVLRQLIDEAKTQLGSTRKRDAGGVIREIQTLREINALTGSLRCPVETNNEANLQGEWDGPMPERWWEVVFDNTSLWSGDHLMDPSVVPGVLFTNRPLKKPAPSLKTLAAAVLAEFGIDEFPVRR